MNGIKVQSVESLKLLRAALVRFRELAQTVLSDADGELQRMLNWMETEAVSHWQGEIRKRQEALARAKDALRAKKLFHPDGFKPSVVDEEKAVRLALYRLEEAQRKLAAVRRYAVILSKEVQQYHGQVQRFGNTVTIDVPIAVGRLEALVRHLERYMAVKPAEAAAEGVAVQDSGYSGADVDEGLGSMARPEGSEDKETGGQGDKETRGQGETGEGVTGEEGSHGRL